jgi:hypothetical protein
MKTAAGCRRDWLHFMSRFPKCLRFLGLQVVDTQSNLFLWNISPLTLMVNVTIILGYLRTMTLVTLSLVWPLFRPHKAKVPFIYLVRLAWTLSTRMHAGYSESDCLSLVQAACYLQYWPGSKTICMEGFFSISKSGTLASLFISLTLGEWLFHSP